MTADLRVRYALRAAAVLLGGLVVAALISALRRDGPAALQAWRTARVGWAWVTLGTACGLVGQAFVVLGWRRLLTRPWSA